MKADEYATKAERLSWLGRTGKTVQVSIDGMDGNGRNKGVVYEHLVFSRRVLKSFYKREFEIPEQIEKIISLIDDGETDDAIYLLRIITKGHKPRNIQPEDEIEIPEEAPAALPWDDKKGEIT